MGASGGTWGAGTLAVPMREELEGRGCLRGGIGETREERGLGKMGWVGGGGHGNSGEKRKRGWGRGRKRVKERTPQMGGPEGTAGRGQEKWEHATVRHGGISGTQRPWSPGGRASISLGAGLQSCRPSPAPLP